MGLFDFLKKPSHQTISLKEYGHASADWSINLASSLVESISKNECATQDSSNFVLSIKGSPFTAQLVFTGLYAACYTVYATHYLGYSQDTTAAEQIADGLRGGMLALNYPPPFTTNKDKEELTNYVMAISKKLADAIAYDLQLADPRHEILFPLVIEIFDKTFKLKDRPKDWFSEGEAFHLYHQIVTVPTDLFIILKDTYKRIGNNIQIQIPNDD